MEINTLLPELVTRIPVAVHEPLAVLALRGGAHRFCVDSELWRQTLTLAPDGDTDTFVLDLSTDDTLPIPIGDGAPIRVRAVYRDGNEISPKCYRYDLATQELILSWAPGVSEVITVEVSVRPTRSLTNYPEWIVAEHGEAIVARAAADLCAQDGKPWFSQGGRETAEADYRRLLSKVRSVQYHDGRGVSLMTPPTFV